MIDGAFFCRIYHNNKYMREIDIYRKARELGIIVKEYDFQEIDGISVFTGYAKYIYVNSNLTDKEKRDTVAHEMVHFEDWTVWVHHIIAEKRAEKGKRERLIPCDKLRKAINDFGEYGIWFLATLFGVSYETMELRIQDIFDL